MADPVTAIAIAGKVFSIFGARKAKKDAKRAAAEEARLEGILTDEQLRRLDREQDFLLGAQATATAQNQVDLSSESYLRVRHDTLTEFDRERRTITAVGASRANTALARGKSYASQANLQMARSAFNLGVGLYDWNEDRKKKKDIKEGGVGEWPKPGG